MLLFSPAPEMLFETDFCAAHGYHCLHETRTNIKLLNWGNGEITELQGNWEEVVS